MSEVIDREVDPEADIEIPIIAFNGEPLLLRIHRSRVGKHGPHDEVHILDVDGEEFGMFHFNDVRGPRFRDVHGSNEERDHVTYFPTLGSDGGIICFNYVDPQQYVALADRDHDNWRAVHG